ncbi:MAG: GNAT family N-acetyltransferase [Oscillospiraceae bacterium]|nr:GNAT family N-acetyltransferase [Candidatus Limimonas coprohippi]
MDFKRATMNDFSKLADFYKYVIDNTEEIFEQVHWRYGMHPTDELLKKYISEGAMYFLSDNGTIVSAMSIPLYQTSDYERITWQDGTKDDEIATLHIFVVNPDYHRRGIGTLMLDKCMEVAKELGIKSLRLDTLVANRRSQALYKKYGFTYQGGGVRTLEDGDDFDFAYYEYKL